MSYDEDAGVCVPTGIRALRGNNAFARVAGMAEATKRVALLRNMVCLATNDEKEKIRKISWSKRGME